MFKLFAAIRYMLRATTLGDSLGEIAITGIREEIIPNMEKLIAREKIDEKKQKMEEILALWKHYSDDAEADSRFWRNIAAKQVRESTRKMKLPMDMAADVEQELASKFLTEPRYKAVFEKFDPMKGPSSLLAYWTSVMANNAFVVARDMMKSQIGWGLGEQVEEMENDEGDARPVLEQIEDKSRRVTNLDARMMAEMKVDLDSAIEHQFGGNPIAMDIYKMWMSLATEKGADAINFRRDITRPLLEVLAKKGVKRGDSIIPQTWKKMQQAILKFFEEHDVYVSKRVKEKMKLAERVAYDEYRMQLASWVLQLRNTQRRLNSL